jgi:hypothetical protein
MDSKEIIELIIQASTTLLTLITVLVGVFQFNKV